MNEKDLVLEFNRYILIMSKCKCVVVVKVGEEGNGEILELY